MAKNRYLADTAPDSPADRQFAITPHDTNDLAEVTRSVYVGTGGDVVIVDRHGSQVTWKNAQTGSILPIRAARVLLTGTTASNLIGLV